MYLLITSCRLFYYLWKKFYCRTMECLVPFVNCFHKTAASFKLKTSLLPYYLFLCDPNTLNWPWVWLHHLLQFHYLSACINSNISNRSVSLLLYPLDSCLRHCIVLYLCASWRKLRDPFTFEQLLPILQNLSFWRCIFIWIRICILILKCPIFELLLLPICSHSNSLNTRHF